QRSGCEDRPTDSGDYGLRSSNTIDAVHEVVRVGQSRNPDDRQSESDLGAPYMTNKWNQGIGYRPEPQSNDNRHEQVHAEAHRTWYSVQIVQPTHERDECGGARECHALRPRPASSAKKEYGGYDRDDR